MEQTIKKLEAVIAEEPVPDFTPDPLDDAGDDFSMAWDQDGDGNKVRVGLTKEETAEMKSLAETGGGDRFLELHNKHEEARHKRLIERHDESLGDKLGRAIRASKTK